MGRNRSLNKHLPKRMHEKCGCYYYVYRDNGKNVWENLGRDYGAALLKWAGIEGRKLERERTVSHAIAHYLETESNRLKPETMAGYRRSAARLIRMFGEIELGDLEPNHVYEYLRRAGNIQANRDKSLLSAVYTAARAWGWYKGDNPAKGIKRNPESARQRYITDSELSALVAAASPQIALIIRFAYLTGLRQRDILRVRLSDLKEDGIWIEESKTGKRKIINWTSDLRAIVSQTRALRRRIESMWLFFGRNGQAYTGDGFRAIWRRVKLRAGIPDIRFHDVRRKTGSDISEEHARSLLGHSDARTTRKHYRVKPEQVNPAR